jgi:succinate dehydrogenase/fumarate reductase flavoprotein subunit
LTEAAQQGSEAIEIDFLVFGGGMAGMTAAARAGSIRTPAF